MHMHPDTYLWLVEQDRERAMTKRALERAAREGGAQQPGFVRGGISSFARILRASASAVTHLHPRRPPADDRCAASVGRLTG
jgi:hypothetical protein